MDHAGKNELGAVGEWSTPEPQKIPYQPEKKGTIWKCAWWHCQCTIRHENRPSTSSLCNLIIRCRLSKSPMVKTALRSNAPKSFWRSSTDCFRILFIVALRKLANEGPKIRPCQVMDMIGLEEHCGKASVRSCFCIINGQSLCMDRVFNMGCSPQRRI